MTARRPRTFLPRAATHVCGLACAALAAMAAGTVVAQTAPASEPPADDSANDPVATGSGPLVATFVAETLVTEPGPNGTTLRHWIPAVQLEVGDQVYYTIRVTNPGKQPVTDVVVTKRLPFGVRYIRGSAVGPDCDVEFSVDGGATYATLPVIGNAASGKPPRKAQPSDYTHVRWKLREALAPGATALLRFRATFT